MSPTKPTGIMLNKPTQSLFAFIGLLFATPSHSWMWMMDPLFGVNYDTSIVKFDRLPKGIESKCPALDKSSDVWVYAQASSDTAMYYLVNRTYVRVKGMGEPEPDNGMLIRIEKNRCHSTDAMNALNGLARPLPGSNDSFAVSAEIAESLFRNSLPYYTSAFHGTGPFLKAIRAWDRDRSDLPQTQWELLDRLRLDYEASHPEVKKLGRLADPISSKKQLGAMYEPIFAINFDPGTRHFEPIGKSIRLTCTHLPRGWPWWIFAEARTMDGSILVLSGLREIIPDGESTDPVLADPDFGIVAKIKGNRCYTINIDNGLRGDPKLIADKQYFPLSSDENRALAKDMVRRYLAAFGGKDSLLALLGKDSLGSENRPKEFSEVLKKLRAR